MTAIANSGTQAADVYAITQQLSRMGSASASKMLGISVSDY